MAYEPNGLDEINRRLLEELQRDGRVGLRRARAPRRPVGAGGGRARRAPRARRGHHRLPRRGRPPGDRLPAGRGGPRAPLRPPDPQDPRARRAHARGRRVRAHHRRGLLPAAPARARHRRPRGGPRQLHARSGRRRPRSSTPRRCRGGRCRWSRRVRGRRGRRAALVQPPDDSRDSCRRLQEAASAWPQLPERRRRASHVEPQTAPSARQLHSRPRRPGAADGARGLHQRGEQRAVLGALGERLGVPLDAEQERRARGPRWPRPSRRRAQATTRRPAPGTSTAWWWKELTSSVAPAPVTAASSESAATLTRCVGDGRDLGLAVAVDVLVQRPAAGDVQRLGAAADAEQRQSGSRRRRARRRARRRRRRRPSAPSSGWRVDGAVGDRVEVGAARQADAVQALHELGHRLEVDGREDDRDRRRRRRSPAGRWCRA